MVLKTTTPSITGLRTCPPAWSFQFSTCPSINLHPSAFLYFFSTFNFPLSVFLIAISTPISIYCSNSCVWACFNLLLIDINMSPQWRKSSASHALNTSAVSKTHFILRPSIYSRLPFRSEPPLPRFISQIQFRHRGCSLVLSAILKETTQAEKLRTIWRFSTKHSVMSS